MRRCIPNDILEGGIVEARLEVTMAMRERDRVVESPTEARQGEPGPSVLAILTISIGLAVLILGLVWLLFFRV